jgi:hypothetical protein
MDDKQLAKLIKKTTQKAARPSKAKPDKTYDPTLATRNEDDDDIDRERMFKEMKRREF